MFILQVFFQTQLNVVSETEDSEGLPWERWLLFPSLVLLPGATSSHHGISKMLAIDKH